MGSPMRFTDEEMSQDTADSSDSSVGGADAAHARSFNSAGLHSAYRLAQRQHILSLMQEEAAESAGDRRAAGKAESESSLQNAHA